MQPVSRRQALRQFTLITAGLAVACTPLRVLTHAYPAAFDDDAELLDEVLRGFVAVVIPGAPSNDPDLVRAFSDRELPFARYTPFFAADLCRRARARFGRSFHHLQVDQRAAIIRDGLAADGTTRKLYGSAIVLAEVAFYAGIYDPKKGCALIGFEGSERWHPLTDITHPDAARFLPAALTIDGNHA
jgi:hypothetical protein